MSGAAALRVLEGSGERVGWAGLMDRDLWLQSELPHGDLEPGYRGNPRIRFDRVARPWLRLACKQWAKDMLLAGRTPGSVSCYVQDIAAFDRWLDRQPVRVDGPRDVSRELIEGFLLYLRTSTLKAATQLRHAGSLARLLDEQREGALRGLPSMALVRRGELPRVDYRLPRGLSETVFGQVIDPSNLAKLRRERDRTVILLLALTGLRVSSVVTLARDALQTGSDGHPYLRYRNVKLKREATLPIAPQLSEQLSRHERWLAEAHPSTAHLLPRRHDPSRTMDHSTVRLILARYVEGASIRHEDGRLAHDVHPHLFRHHLGTSLVNDGVPLPVVQKMLDHNSIEMTAHYARIHDETLRREVARWMERVNVRGERIALCFDGPDGEVAWVKERIARAKQALPNGYCGLPLVQTCPHPNACLSCDNFLTDPSFRQIHEDQLAQTRRLKGDAEANGHVRLVEVLERDEGALTRILTGLHSVEPSTEAPDAQMVDLVALAERGA